MVADVRKVALLMSCLPHRLAETLIERLPTEYGEALHLCLDELTDVDRLERQRVVREFLGSCQPTSRRCYRVDTGQSQTPSTHFPIPVPPAKIAKLLQDEMPQTQAVILSQLSSVVSEQVLASMSDDRRTQVAHRLEHLSVVPDAALQDITEVYALLFSGQR